MSGIKPIETYYNGYRFRSRLEARWAVFFDALNIKYVYEPDGFELDGGYRYLPDFYLPETETYVEIKPEDAFEIKMTCDGILFPENAAKYAYATNAITLDMGKMFLIAFGDPYHALSWPIAGESVSNSHLFYVAECAVHMVMRLANEHSDTTEFYCETECGERKNCSECDHWQNIATHSFLVFIADDTFIASGNGLVREHLLPFESVLGNSEKIMSKWKPCYEAALKARQARFEHGETPTI